MSRPSSRARARRRRVGYLGLLGLCWTTVGVAQSSADKPGTTYLAPRGQTACFRAARLREANRRMYFFGPDALWAFIDDTSVALVDRCYTMRQGQPLVLVRVLSPEPPDKMVMAEFAIPGREVHVFMNWAAVLMLGMLEAREAAPSRTTPPRSAPDPRAESPRRPAPAPRAGRAPDQRPAGPAYRAAGQYADTTADGYLLRGVQVTALDPHRIVIRHGLVGGHPEYGVLEDTVAISDAGVARIVKPGRRPSAWDTGLPCDLTYRFTATGVRVRSNVRQWDCNSDADEGWFPVYDGDELYMGDLWPLTE